MRKAQEIYRLNLELGPKSLRALDFLQSMLEVTSRVEAIRLALQTCAQLALEVKNGGRVVVERANGEEVEIPIAPLEAIPKRSARALKVVTS